MAKWLATLVFVLSVTLFTSAAFAEGETKPAATEGAAVASAAAGNGLGQGLSAVAAGLVVLGVGLGIGRIGGQAAEGIARQPEVYNNIQTAMIISAALIEGAALFALIICLMKG